MNEFSDNFWRGRVIFDPKLHCKFAGKSCNTFSKKEGEGGCDFNILKKSSILEKTGFPRRYDLLPYFCPKKSCVLFSLKFCFPSSSYPHPPTSSLICHLSLPCCPYSLFPFLILLYCCLFGLFVCLFAWYAIWAHLVVLILQTLSSSPHPNSCPNSNLELIQ